MLTSTSARRLVSDFSDFAFASVGWSCGSGCGCGGFRGASSSGFASLLPWLALLAPALAASALLSCCNRSYASCFILLSCYIMLFNFHSISQCDEGTFRGDLDLSGVTSQHCGVRVNFWSCLPAHARSIPIETHKKHKQKPSKHLKYSRLLASPACEIQSALHHWMYLAEMEAERELPGRQCLPQRCKIMCIRGKIFSEASIFAIFPGCDYRLLVNCT